MRIHQAIVGVALISVLLGGCASDSVSDGTSGQPESLAPVEAISLMGGPLRRPALSDDARRGHETRLAEAEAAYRRAPDNETAAIWYGRRLAYLGRYNDAIEAFTDALERHPESFRLLRHRGHRFITLRRFDEAIADLERAESLMRGVPDETEPDGLPNALGIPISSTRTNILYHLGLAHYLKGEFDASREVFARCLGASRNDDNVVSASYWLVLSQMRSGRRDEGTVTLARISTEMDVIENHAYHRLLLMFKGELDPSAFETGDGIQGATASYGVAAWRLLNGEQDEAERGFRAVIDAGVWPAFGHIASEAELARLR